MMRSTMTPPTDFLVHAMSDAHSPIRTLARTSLRLIVFLVVSVLLVIVLVLTCYWSLLRLVEEE